MAQTRAPRYKLENAVHFFVRFRFVGGVVVDEIQDVNATNPS